VYREVQLNTYESFSPPLVGQEKQSIVVAESTRKRKRASISHQNEGGKQQKISPVNQWTTGPEHLTGVNGLSCETSACIGTDCNYLSYLWEMTHLYASFHSDGVKKIREGKSSSVRTLTWYCGGLNSCGGLGYRFQGMTVTWLLGMLTGRVILFKWSHESTVNKHLMPNMIDWRYPDYKLEGTSFDVGNFADFMEHFGARNFVKYNRKLLEAVTGNITHVEAHYNLLECINHLIFKVGLHYKLPIGNIPGIKLPSPPRFHHKLTESVGILSMFNFTNKLKSYIRNVQLHLHNVTNGSKYIALHLRTGRFDDLFEPKIQKRTAHRSDWKIAADCALKQADKHIGPNSIVLVVSDSTEAKNWLVQEYFRVRTFDTKIVHLDMSTTIDEEGMLGVWQDITTLAQALILVKHISTFSDIPAAMCGIPSQRIIDYTNCKHITAK